MMHENTYRDANRETIKKFVGYFSNFCKFNTQIYGLKN